MFEMFFQPWMRWHLSGVYTTGVPDRLPEHYTVIWAANHPSWWDGFLLRELHQQYASALPLVTLMEKEQLEGFPFLRWLGVVGIESSSRSVLRVSRQLRRFHRKGPFGFSLFPQGEITPSWIRPLNFQRGVVLFARLLAPVLVVPVGIHLEALNRPSPAAFVAAAPPLELRDGTSLNIQQVEAGVETALNYIYNQIERYGEKTPQYWPGSATSLPKIDI